MNAELIAVGTELLLGDTINTDAAAVAAKPLSTSIITSRSSTSMLRAAASIIGSDCVKCEVLL